MHFRGGISGTEERGGEKFQWGNRKIGLQNATEDLKTQIMNCQ